MKQHVQQLANVNSLLPSMLSKVHLSLVCCQSQLRGDHVETIVDDDDDGGVDGDTWPCAVDRPQRGHPAASG